MNFSKIPTAVTALALVTIAVLGFAAIAGAATSEQANTTAEFDNESNVTVEIEWNESISDVENTSANVSFYDEDAWQIDGDDVTDSALNSTTLNDTVAEFDPDNVTAGASYDVELNQSNTTVTVNASDIADDGTVNLSDHTSDSITSDDEIVSVTANAQLIVDDSIAAEEGNTTTTEYTSDDGLEDGTEYRVLVEAPDSAVDSVTVDAGAVGGFFGGDSAAAGSASFGLVAIVLVLGGGWMLTRD